MILNTITTRGLLAATVAILMSACGGGGSSSAPLSSEPAPPLSVSTFPEADFVIGQPDFVSNDAPVTPDATNLATPASSAAYGNGVLYVADSQYNRVLGFDALPETNNPAADFVLGQPDFTSNGTGEADGFYNPMSPVVSGGKLFVADPSNARVVIYDPAPSDGPVSGSVVVGQPDFTTTAVGCSNNDFDGGELYLSVAGNKLVVADSSNDRVLIWNSIPTENGQPADLVLGQADFNSCSSPANATANTLYRPLGVWTDGNRLVVADNFHNRVLIWNAFPTENNQAADLVLGQDDFTHDTRNDLNQDGTPDGFPTAQTMYGPSGSLASNGSNLFISDAGNSRVLVWNTFPTENFQPADAVIGQAKFTNSTVNDDNQDGAEDSGPSSRTFDYPYGLTLAANRYLLVSDPDNYRVLGFDLRK